jgi:ArsR family transcriptional regulator
MAQNKKADFSLSDQEMANFAKALSHPARIAIIKILAEQNSCICGEIVEVLPLAQSTVSQHLKELQEQSTVRSLVIVSIGRISINSPPQLVAGLRISIFNLAIVVN